MILSNIKVKVGDKFSTENKLLGTVGFKKTKSLHTKNSQIKELKRYLSYEKTGKISRGKVTNEIVITEIYDVPKEKEDNRNGGNNRSIISDYLYNCIVTNLEDIYGFVDGSKSSIIKQFGLVNYCYNDYYYDFEDSIGDFTSAEKEFFFDFCESVMTSYKGRLKRILDNLGDKITITNYYKIVIHGTNRYGDECYYVEDINDTDNIEQIIKTKENLETLYGINDNSEKWKIFIDKNKSKKFYEDFITQVKISLCNDDIVNCFEAMTIRRNDTDDVDADFECKFNDDVNDSDDMENFYKAQQKLIDSKIQTVLNKTKSIYDTSKMRFVKVPKYNVEDITKDVLDLCKEIVNIGQAEKAEQKALNKKEEEDSAWIDGLNEIYYHPTAEYHSAS